MFPTSDRFQRALRSTHRMVAYVDLLLADATTVTAKITGGTVNIDRTAEVRRSADIDIVVSDLASTIVDRLKRVNPYTTRVQVYRGLRYGDGVEEVVPLGRFWIDEVQWSADEAVMSLSCTDQTSVVMAAQMPFQRNIKSDSTISTISALLAETYSDSWDALTPTDNLIVHEAITDLPLEPVTIEGDRWEIVAAMAASLGADLWADYESTKFRLTPVPVLDQMTPVFTVNGGDEGVLVEYDRSVSREGVYNSVIARAENVVTTAYSVYAIAEDTDPLSPTYIGNYGRSVTTVEDNLLNTTAKCQMVADGVLANSLGLQSNLDLTTVPNPALDAGDCIEVVYPNGLRERHIIDGLSIPLEVGGTFTIKTRSTTERL